jgi:predicted small metal-binding protein
LKYLGCTGTAWSRLRGASAFLRSNKYQLYPETRITGIFRISLGGQSYWLFLPASPEFPRIYFTADRARKGDPIMGKVIECAKVDPSSGCKHVVRGNTEEEVLKNAMEHAKQHGIREVTPELKAKVKAAIRDEK